MHVSLERSDEQLLAWPYRTLSYGAIALNAS
ncbi:hypothetical protein ABIB75_007814 [Bradyrhizobium sp. GM2.2]